MDYIRVTKENLDREHICCAISNNNDVQAASKKAWLADRFDEGLVFLKSTERGKCFIEYLPAECAWVPIVAPNYLYIDCLWVAGSFKGQGCSTDLLDACIADARAGGKEGLCILSSRKKLSFLSDPKFLSHKGFRVCDEADNNITLCYLPLKEGAVAPAFRSSAKHPHIAALGYVLYYTHQCPFNAKYVPLLEAFARENGIPFHTILLDSREKAQCAPTPVTTYALFYNGKYVTNEQMNEARFRKLLQKNGELK